MKHVLIAEDKYESRYLLKVLLEGHGYRVTEACNGDEALTAAKKEAPDIIISDVLMPVMDGFELCQQWMKDPVLSRVPFIFYSATYTTENDRKLAMSLGALRYIIKPQAPEALISELQQALEQWDHIKHRPAPLLPDDTKFHTQHDAAMAHKLNDKILELEETNIKLLASERKYRGIYESLQDLYIETTIDGTVLDVSPLIGEFTGGQYTREDIIGSNIAEFYEDPSLYHTFIESLKQQGSVRDFEINMKNRDGSSIPCSISALLIHTDDGSTGRIAGMIRDITRRKQDEMQLAHYHAKIEQAFLSTVKVVMRLGEMRDPYTAGHERRVAEIAVAIATELGFDAYQLEGIRVAGYLHDIGKITIPQDFLVKPGRISKVEYDLIKGHAQAGYDVLKDVEFPWPVAQVALQHHERLDGSGYPRGLKGDEILTEARIMAVADVVEAMSSHRPYRAALGIDAGLAEIEQGRGRTYDPAVVDACLRLFRDRGMSLPQ